MFDQNFIKVALFQWFKVVKPGKRRRGAQRQGELDCLHEQFICYQYLHQFQQVSAPGSWRPCREGQRSNWDESTEEPRDHGICRLENSIKLLDSQCKWRGRYLPQRYSASAPGMDNNGEDCETLFQSKRFPFGEHIWPHIQWPGDGSMFVAKITMEQVNGNLIIACTYMAIYHLSSVNHLLYSSTMMSTSYTRGHHQHQGWQRWDWVVHQARTCSCPVPTYHCSSGADIWGKLQFKVYFGHGRLQKLRSHLYIAIPSKPDTEARGPGQSWTQKISLFSKPLIDHSSPSPLRYASRLIGFAKSLNGLKDTFSSRVNTAWKTKLIVRALFVCSLILTKIWQNINVKTLKDVGRNFKFGWRFDFQKCFSVWGCHYQGLYLHLSCADMALHVLTNRKIGHLVIFNMMIWIHQGLWIWLSKCEGKHWTIYF